MKHLGDITKISGYEVEPVDIICGGSPCQDLSVAGKRAGLAGERSGLFMEQIRIIKEMRERGKADDVIRPRYMVWENVPGAFSSNNGEDFRAVLEETAKIADENATIPRPENGKWAPAGCIVGDEWSIAWRVHDAQYWGVPQRRKRICLLADFNGDTAGKVLFELQRETTNRDTEQAIVDIGAESRSEVQSVSKGLSGDIAQSGKEGEGVTEDTERCAGEASTIAFEPGAASRVGGHAYEDVAGTVRANAGDNQQAVVYGIGSYDSNAMKSDNPHSGIYEADTSRTLDLNGGNPGCNQGGMAVVETIAFQGQAGAEASLQMGDDVSSTLSCTKQVMAVVYRGDSITSPINASNPMPGDPCHTLTNDNRNYVVQGADVYNGELTGEKAATLTAASGASPTHSGPSVVQGFDAYNQASTGDVAMPLRNKAADSDHIPVVCIEGNGQRESHKGDGYKESDTMYTLNTVEQHAVCIENHPADSRVKIAKDGKVQTLSSRIGTGGGNVPMILEELYTSSKSSHHQRFTHDGKAETNAQFNFAVDEEKIGTQVAKGPGAVCNTVVRRLTPLECTRLQGFPNGWVDIGEWVDSKGKPRKDSDANKYKALGNSIALPFWQWLAERIVDVSKSDGINKPTMASLFDGIGGFPLVFSRQGCKPVWASEIEDFPIAVTKKRFKEEKNVH